MAQLTNSTNSLNNYCTICGTFVHGSNQKSQCQICSCLAHQKCVSSFRIDYFCRFCVASSLPFVNLPDEEFLGETVGLSLALKMSRLGCDHKLNLNPFDNLDEGLIDDDAIDADRNYYNTDTNVINNYCDSLQLDNILAPNKSVNLSSLIHINVRSLTANVDKLCLNLATLRHKFSVVAVSETWLSASTEECINMPGYDKVIKSRVGRHGGGVALFLDADLDIKFKPRPDLEYPDESVYESLFIQISQPLLKTKDIIVGVVYRPPGTQLEKFYDCFFPMIEKINSENRPCYILGDFNIDLLTNSVSSQVYLNKFLSNGFYPRIDRPTRITEYSSTLIDHIFTNAHKNDTMSGIWVADIADHLPIYITLSHISADSLC